MIDIDCYTHLNGHIWVNSVDIEFGNVCSGTLVLTHMYLGQRFLGEELWIITCTTKTPHIESDNVGIGSIEFFSTLGLVTYFYDPWLEQKPKVLFRKKPVGRSFGPPLLCRAPVRLNTKNP